MQVSASPAVGRQERNPRTSCSAVSFHTKTLRTVQPSWRNTLQTVDGTRCKLLTEHTANSWRNTLQNVGGTHCKLLTEHAVKLLTEHAANCWRNTLQTVDGTHCRWAANSWKTLRDFTEFNCPWKFQAWPTEPSDALKCCGCVKVWRQVC